MMCEWCRWAPRHLRDIAGDRLITISDGAPGTRDYRVEDKDVICPECVAAIRRVKEERMALGRQRRREELREAGVEPEDAAANEMRLW